MAYGNKKLANTKKKRKEDALALAQLIYDIYTEKMSQTKKVKG